MSVEVRQDRVKPRRRQGRRTPLRQPFDRRDVDARERGRSITPGLQRDDRSGHGLASPRPRRPALS